MLRIERAPLPEPAALWEGVRAFADIATRAARPHDLDARDQSFIDRVEPLLGLLYDHYFRCETEIEEELPDGPLLAVANHNAMTGMPDMFCHMAAFWRRYSTRRLAYGLMHDVPFRFPVAGAWLNAAGAISANRVNARRALDRGAAVLVFPGGDLDACKPYSRRYSIEFGRRRGFIRTAIRERVPIVPVVSVGAHSGLYIWTDGRAIAELLRLPMLARSNVAPIGVAMPWGIIFGVPFPHLPPPVKIHTRILRPIDFGLPPDAADDTAEVERAFARVSGVMQAAMYELRHEGRHGLFPRGKA
jgi:1-acyl-sn-glycerol-3-phosphate acyltransferase